MHSNIGAIFEHCEVLDSVAFALQHHHLGLCIIHTQAEYGNAADQVIIHNQPLLAAVVDISSKRTLLFRYIVS